MTLAIILNVMITTAMFATLLTYWISQRAGDFVGEKNSRLNLLYTTITFMALATGLCAHCSRAVLQGLFGKATPFVRTPKLNITADNNELKGKQAYDIQHIPVVVFVELGLAVLFAGLAVIGLGHPQQIFFGVYAFYAIGFLVVSLLSLRETATG